MGAAVAVDWSTRGWGHCKHRLLLNCFNQVSVAGQVAIPSHRASSACLSRAVSYAPRIGVSVSRGTLTHQAVTTPAGVHRGGLLDARGLQSLCAPWALYRSCLSG